ncbi:hypothetical protein BB558_000550, partial [Smittium angustum]
MQLILSVYVIFGGALVNPSYVTPLISWVKYLSFNYYTYMAAMQNEMKGLVFKCSTDSGTGCYPTGESVLESYNLTKFSIAQCIGINLGMAVE